MSYLIVLLVVALAAAPLLHFAPSKRQRRVARLREHAALSGLFVEFRNMPGGVPAVTSGSKGSVIYYGHRLPPPKRGEQRAGVWARSAEGWRAVGQRRAVPACLGQLPDDVQAASVDNGSCGVYWQERGEEQEIDAIAGALKAWATDL